MSESTEAAEKAAVLAHVSSHENEYVRQYVEALDDEQEELRGELEEATEEIELRFFMTRVQADLRGHELREQLGKLPELQKSGIGILGEIPLGEHAKADELVVMGLEMREIGTRTCQLSELLSVRVIAAPAWRPTRTL